MNKRIVSEALSLDSLDGVMDESAWTAPYRSDERTAFKRAELFASAALRLGRVTYQGFKPLRTRQGAGNPAARMNSANNDRGPHTLKLAGQARWVCPRCGPRVLIVEHGHPMSGRSV